MERLQKEVGIIAMACTGAYQHRGWERVVGGWNCGGLGKGGGRLGPGGEWV